MKLAEKEVLKIYFEKYEKLWKQLVKFRNVLVFVSGIYYGLVIIALLFFVNLLDKTAASLQSMTTSQTLMAFNLTVSALLVCLALALWLVPSIADAIERWLEEMTNKLADWLDKIEEELEKNEE